ncbi:hypothetical protein ACSPAH_23175 [Buttiauxella agrestis]
MKKTLSVLFVIHALLFCSSANASENDNQPVVIEYSLYHGKELLLAGSQAGYPKVPMVFHQVSVTEYKSAVVTNYNFAGDKVDNVEKSHLESGLNLNVLPDSRNGFVSAIVSFNYSVLNDLIKVKDGPEKPDVSLVSINQPLYFQSGESRKIDFCLKTDGCKNSEYHLYIKATIQDLNKPL